MVTLVLPTGQIRHVTGGKVLLPRTGVWLADLRIDERDDLPDHVVLDLGAVEMPAAVVRTESIAGMIEVRLVGGAGGIGETARPKHYYHPLLRHVLADLLRDAGETLSPASTASALSTPLEAWTTIALPMGAMLAALCQIAGPGVTWRVLADGTVWLGAETWPDSPVEYRSIDSDGPNAATIVGTDIPGLWPGTLLGGRPVDQVRHDLDDDRTVVLFGDAA